MRVGQSSSRSSLHRVHTIEADAACSLIAGARRGASRSRRSLVWNPRGDAPHRKHGVCAGYHCAQRFGWVFAVEIALGCMHPCVEPQPSCVEICGAAASAIANMTAAGLEAALNGIAKALMLAASFRVDSFSASFSITSKVIQC